MSSIPKRFVQVKRFKTLTILCLCIFQIWVNAEEDDFFNGIDQNSKYSAESNQQTVDTQVELQNEVESIPRYVGGVYDSRITYITASEGELDRLHAIQLEKEDYQAPSTLDVSSSKNWNKLIVELPKLIEEIESINSIKENDKRTIVGVDLKGIHPQNPRLSNLEQSSAIASFQLVENFKLLRQQISLDNDPEALIKQFEEVLKETREAIHTHLQNIVDMGSEGTVSQNPEFEEFLNNVSSSEGNSIFFQIDQPDDFSASPIETFKGTPLVSINFKIFDSIDKPKDSSNQRDLNNYRKAITKAGAIRISKTSNKSGLLPPRKYVIRRTIKNSQGVPIGVVVSSKSNSPTGYIIPFNTDKKRSYRSVTKIAQFSTSANKVSSFKAFNSILKPVKDLTVARSDIGSNFADNYTQFSLDDAKELRDASLKFYSESMDNQALLLGQKFEYLRELYMDLDRIQNFLLSIGQQFEINHGKSGETDGSANQLFFIGSSQNLLAAVVSLICQKYQFDSSGRLVDGQTIKNEYNLRNVIVTEYAVVRQSRLGNFYSVGTNNSNEVMAYDNIHRGQYSVNYFVYSGIGEPKIGIQYTGLNYSQNNSNTFKVHVLDTQHSQFSQLKTELSSMTPDQEALSEKVYYKLPLENTQTYKDHPEIVLATKEIKSSITKDDFSINLSGKVKAGELFAVYQEASGLRAESRNQWVDYDEVLTHVFAWNSRAFEPVDKDSFRIIVDGSGTMKNLFKPVIDALNSEFKELGMQDFLKPESALKPLYYFGQGKAAKSPYGLSSLTGSVQAAGNSPLNLAVKQLVCPKSPATCSSVNIPDKPWTLLIISDFDSKDKHFLEENWATSLAIEGTNGQPTTQKIRVDSMMIKDSDSNFRVHSSAGGKGWKSLQSIHLIGVGPFLGETNTNSLQAQNWLVNNQSLAQGSFGVRFNQIAKNDTDALAKSIRQFLKPIADSIKMYDSHKHQSADW